MATEQDEAIPGRLPADALLAIQLEGKRIQLGKGPGFMGYHTSLHLVDVKIRDDSLSIVRKALELKRRRRLGPLKYFLDQAVLPDDGYLCFTPTGSYTSQYVADEEDGTVPALEGKWRNCEEIAQWLKLHSTKGGQLIQHSGEGDGAAWGWEPVGVQALACAAACGRLKPGLQRRLWGRGTDD